MMQWKCGICGNWVSMASLRHGHPKLVEPTMAEMIAARDKPGYDALAPSVITVFDQWTANHETRRAPGNE